MLDLLITKIEIEDAESRPEAVTVPKDVDKARISTAWNQAWAFYPKIESTAPIIWHWA